MLRPKGDICVICLTGDAAEEEEERMEEPKDREKAVKCWLMVTQKMEGIDRDSCVLDTVVLTSWQLQFPASDCIHQQSSRLGNSRSTTASWNSHGQFQRVFPCSSITCLSAKLTLRTLIKLRR